MVANIVLAWHWHNPLVLATLDFFVKTLLPQHHLMHMRQAVLVQSVITVLLQPRLLPHVLLEPIIPVNKLKIVPPVLNVRQGHTVKLRG
jgi:hypothetical protein